MWNEALQLTEKNIGKQLIRNSTAEFLIFTGQAGEQSIEARYEDETIGLSQKLIAALFDVTIPTVNERLKNIFESGGLQGMGMGNGGKSAVDFSSECRI
ncbi:hypothetical protein BMS3Bbin14_00059 [bacterium BMS3Bbin14]|nr:hypothetical protein BMS3Abin13_02031 [bacterium BMS3Abin13]GBE51606.1 hypothetical protein BMS3Bbin14_00059 [bacterium BMS3Bbin14]